ncbi:MAG: KH domain-containing protein [Verrucomicrobiaceae bacterium]|nr:MAG: KH domain-containing protein [Verrucomicrobiaceae bacterium]
MDEFLRYVIGSLVEFPDEVVFTKTETPERIIFHVAMRKTDLPRIIGKGGHTIQALRTLLNAAAQKRGTKAALEIIE